MLKIKLILLVLLILALSGCVTQETYVSSGIQDASPGEGKIYIEGATTVPSEMGRIPLGMVTSGVALAFQKNGARIVDSKDEADYVVSSKVVELTDLFDNIAHVLLEVKSTSNQKTVYLGKFVGTALTQSSSMSIISAGIYKAMPEIYGSINKHFAEIGSQYATIAPPIKNSFPVVKHTTNAPATFSKVTGERLALVIGNSTYKSSPLKNPVRDAQDVSMSLRHLGFTVIQKNNASLREMESAINQFHGTLKQGGIGLFYYAGHGVQVDGKNYLVPTDAVIGSESDTKYECVDAGRVLGKMEDAGNSMNIVILDACRNNPFARSFRSASRGLVRMDAPTGSILAYSTAPGDIAADGSGRNGIYTKHLLQHMMTPGLDINSVFIRTRMAVIQETGGKQVPWESSSLTGIFYFVGQESKLAQ